MLRKLFISILFIVSQCFAQAGLDDKQFLDNTQEQITQVQQELQAVESRFVREEGDKQDNNMSILLQLQAFAYRHQLSALAGIELEKKSTNPSFSSAKEGSEVWVINQLGIDVSSLEMEITSIHSMIASIKSHLEDLVIAKADTESSLNQLDETRLGNTVEDDGDVKLAELKEKIKTYNANISASNAQLTWYRLQLKNRHAALAHLKDLLAKSAVKPVFSDDSLNAIYADLAQSEQTLHKEHEAISAELQTHLFEFLQSMDSSASANMSNNAKDLIALRLKNNVLITGIISDQLFLNSLERMYWQQQHAFAKNSEAFYKSNGNLEEWLGNINNLDKHLSEGLDLTRAKIQEWKLVDKNTGQPFLELWHEREMRYLHAQKDVRRIQALFNSLHQLLKRNAESHVLKSSIEYLNAQAQSWLLTVWHFEITAIDEVDVINGESITVRRSVTIEKIVRAFLLIMIGFYIAVKISNVIARFSIRFLKFKPLDVAVFRKWSLVFIFLLLLLNSLFIVHIPLGVFAFAGGALALGLGIGMQALLKNVVSGFMIQLERPFKPGDFIDINGMQGEVIDMGVRAAIILSPNGVETVVPNSSFIDSNFTNWTMRNSHVRFELLVGVAYGSDTTLVRELLLGEVNRHGLVEKDPKPDVLFSDFGSDALQFLVWFWVDMRKQNSPKKIASDLRFMIEKTLRQNNIIIAFPQRDVHLNMDSPLNVNVNMSAQSVSVDSVVSDNKS